MKAEIEPSEAADSRSSKWNAGPAPSLRIPVTADNRALLRRLRAAEMSAWADPATNRGGGSSRGRRCFPAHSLSPENFHI
jgi:hypothetical protein